jgi:excisionase family DNA binding protein
VTDYLKIPELAQRLDVSQPTVRRMVKGGKLPSVFVGGAYRVSEQDLEEYLENARVIPGGASPLPDDTLPRTREEHPFILVQRLVEDENRNQWMRWVVRWVVPPQERGRYRKDLHTLFPSDDYLEEELPPQVTEALMAGAA